MSANARNAGSASDCNDLLSAPGDGRTPSDWKPRMAEVLRQCAVEWERAALEHRAAAVLAMAQGRADLAAIHHYAAQHDEQYAIEDRKKAGELMNQ